MRILDALHGSKPAFSFEFFPPSTPKGRERLLRTIGHLAELEPAFVSVTYGAGGGTRSDTVEIAQTVRERIGVEAVVHMTCRGHSKPEIAASVERMQRAGIENVLALRGDAPSGGVAPTGDFSYADELVAFLRGGWPLCIGAACYPETHIESPSADEDMARLKDKVDAGVDFLITQLFFDNAKYHDFVERARKAGIEVPIVPGIMPVTKLAQLDRFVQMCGASVPAALRDELERWDDEDAVQHLGIAWAVRQCRELLANGAPGIHFYTLNRSLATWTVCSILQGP